MSYREGIDFNLEELDFISIYTYPLWELKTIDHAMAYTKQNYHQVSQKYPDKVVIITEAGWATDAMDVVFQKIMRMCFSKNVLRVLLRLDSKQQHTRLCF